MWSRKTIIGHGGQSENLQDEPDSSLPSTKVEQWGKEKMVVF